jgi:hypothetical protein
MNRATSTPVLSGVIEMTMRMNTGSDDLSTNHIIRTMYVIIAYCEIYHRIVRNITKFMRKIFVPAIVKYITLSCQISQCLIPPQVRRTAVLSESILHIKR